MTNAPFFTVITACRNAEHSLDVTASSLRAQRFTDYEWIVVDGASTDNTCDVARRYIDSRRDTLISKPDRGVYFAMNTGLRFARGAFVLFLNAGDRLAEPETLTTVYGAIDQSVDVLHGDVIFVTERGDMIPRSSKDATGGVDRQLLASHQSVYVRRSIHFQIPFDTDLRISADFKVFAMLHAAGARFRYLPEPLSITTLEDNSISVRGRARMAWEDFNVNRSVRGMSWLQSAALLAKTQAKIAVIVTLKRLPDLIFLRIPDCVRKRIY